MDKHRRVEHSLGICNDDRCTVSLIADAINWSDVNSVVNNWTTIIDVNTSPANYGAALLPTETALIGDMSGVIDRGFWNTSSNGQVL